MGLKCVGLQALFERWPTHQTNGKQLVPTRLVNNQPLSPPIGGENLHSNAPACLEGTVDVQHNQSVLAATFGASSTC